MLQYQIKCKEVLVNVNIHYTIQYSIIVMCELNTMLCFFYYILIMYIVYPGTTNCIMLGPRDV